MAKSSASASDKKLERDLNASIKKMENYLNEAKGCKVKGLKKFPAIPKQCASLKTVESWIARTNDVLAHNEQKLKDEKSRIDKKDLVKESVLKIRRMGGQFHTRKSK